MIQDFFVITETFLSPLGDKKDIDFRSLINVITETFLSPLGDPPFMNPFIIKAYKGNFFVPKHKFFTTSVFCHRY